MWEAARVSGVPWLSELFPKEVLQRHAELTQGCGFDTLSFNLAYDLSDRYYFKLTDRLHGLLFVDVAQIPATPAKDATYRHTFLQFIFVCSSGTLCVNQAGFQFTEIHLPSASASQVLELKVCAAMLGSTGTS